jgi:hypothetical protein
VFILIEGIQLGSGGSSPNPVTLVSLVALLELTRLLSKNVKIKIYKAMFYALFCIGTKFGLALCGKTVD